MVIPVRKKVMDIIIPAIVIYLLLLFILTVFQRKIIYYPYELDKDFKFPMYVTGLEEVFIPCEDVVTINGLYAPGKENKPAFLIFHGNAGNITAYWKGYKEYKENGKIAKLPKMLGFQAEGASPIVSGHVVKNPKTIATAIKIGNPVNWKQAEAARDESGGLIEAVTDKEILEAYKLLARGEGVFVEPASAAGIAGVLKKAKEGYFGDARRMAHGGQRRIVCVLTGHGLKDPDRAIVVVKNPKTLPAKLSAVMKEIGL